MEDRENQIFEFAYIDLDDRQKLWAQKVDLSGAEPVLIEDSKRQIGKLKKAGNEELSVSADKIVWDTRDVARGASLVHSIPEGGTGMATKNMYYDSHAKFHCASAINFTADKWVTNVGDLAEENHCIPGENSAHSGFVILETKNHDEPIVDMKDWVMNPSDGGIKVIWPPESVDGQRTISYGDEPKLGGFGWYAGPWTNHDDYMSVQMKDGPGPYPFLLNWQDNVWYKLTQEGEKGRTAAVWFDNVDFPATSIGKNGNNLPIQFKNDYQPINPGTMKWQTPSGRDIQGKSVSPEVLK